MSIENYETRNRILKATLELLEKNLGKGVRMSDIAREAGFSRQAVYLNFNNRAELLIAATRYQDQENKVDERLAASRGAGSGIERLDAFVEAWGNYIPLIYGVARAFLTISDSDETAAQAWAERMQDVREGCEAAIKALASDGTLTPELKPGQATDLLWTMLSVRNWEQLTIDCGWSQKKYIQTLKSSARRIFVEK